MCPPPHPTSEVVRHVCLGFAFVDHYVRSRRGCEEENASKFVPSQRDTAGQPRPMTSIFGRCSAFKTRPEVSKPLRDRLFEVQPVTMSYYSRTGTLCNRFCISSSSFWVARSLLRTRFSLRSLSLRRDSTWFACSHRPRLVSLSLSLSNPLFPPFFEKFPPPVSGKTERSLEVRHKRT